MNNNTAALPDEGENLRKEVAPPLNIRKTQGTSNANQSWRERGATLSHFSHDDQNITYSGVSSRLSRDRGGDAST